jgi:hypothetical protein
MVVVAGYKFCSRGWKFKVIPKNARKTNPFSLLIFDVFFFNFYTGGAQFNISLPMERTEAKFLLAVFIYFPILFLNVRKTHSV